MRTIVEGVLITWRMLNYHHLEGWNMIFFNTSQLIQKFPLFNFFVPFFSLFNFIHILASLVMKYQNPTGNTSPSTPVASRHQKNWRLQSWSRAMENSTTRSPWSSTWWTSQRTKNSRTSNLWKTFGQSSQVQTRVMWTRTLPSSKANPPQRQKNLQFFRSPVQSLGKKWTAGTGWFC